MLADDVRLDLVEKAKRQGAVSVGKYFGNYDAVDDWLFTLGFLEKKPAILVSELNAPDEVIYVVLLKWTRVKIALIRDYRYARLVMLDADIEVARDGK